MEQYESGHLGGCVKGGDPSTYYPNLWNFIIQDFGIKSILDIGCGEGHAIEYFNSKGIKSVGLEGYEESINNSKVKNLIIKHDFVNGSYKSYERFDAIWCCEFLEHVDSKYEDNIFETIHQSTAKYVFLTHAIPGQGGYHHVNLQHPSYWISRFHEYGYVLSAKSTRQLRELAFFENIIPNDNHYYNNGLVFIREKNIKTDSGSEINWGDEIDWGSDKFNIRFKNETDNAIITWASGKEFCKNPGIKVFVNSLNRCGYKGHKIVFTNDMDIDTREYFENNCFKIIDVDPNKSQWVVRDRFLSWYNFLKNENNCYWYVGLFDCKDVVFQENPFQSCCNLLLISEGKKHSDCEWNTQDQTNLRKFNNCYQSEFKEDPVICAGTIMGDKNEISNLCASIWTSTLLSGRCTDQAVLNFLYKNVYSKACLSNPVLDNICLTADLPKESPPIIKDGLFCNALTGRPYQIYHQYDRVPENKKIIYERYLNE
jgi:SAM-dependent methyltransferase